MKASLARIKCIARIQAGLERNPALYPVPVADGATDEVAAGAALPADQYPTMIASASAAGNRVSKYTGCARSCSSSDASCQQ